MNLCIMSNKMYKRQKSFEAYLFQHDFFCSINNNIDDGMTALWHHNKVTFILTWNVMSCIQLLQKVIDVSAPQRNTNLV